MSKIEERTSGGQNSIGPKEATEALNEQGFLFAQVVRDLVANRIEKTVSQDLWHFVEQEYPVTSTDGAQTRIDIILCHHQVKNVFLCMECKRPNRKYKSWLFFDRLPNDSPLHLETVDRFTPQATAGRNPPQHKIDHKLAKSSCDVFNYYLEAAIKRNSDNASSTDTIERAMRQLVAAQTGLISKLGTFTTPLNYFRSIPVLVTSAQLFEAEFPNERIDRANGTIEETDLKLKPLEFCAVNYHADDSLSLGSLWQTKRKDDIKTDISYFQTRTVFIAQASALDNFLIWASKNLTEVG